MKYLRNNKTNRSEDYCHWKDGLLYTHRSGDSARIMPRGPHWEVPWSVVRQKREWGTSLWFLLKGMGGGGQSRLRLANLNNFNGLWAQGLSLVAQNLTLGWLELVCSGPKCENLLSRWLQLWILDWFVCIWLISWFLEGRRPSKARWLRHSICLFRTRHVCHRHVG